MSEISNDQILIFEVDLKNFAVEISDLQEILPMMEVQPVPTALNPLAGTINLRGTIIPVLDLKKCFGGERASYSAGARILTSQIAGRHVGFIVDRASEILDFDAHAIKDAALQREQLTFIKGMIPLPSGETISLITLDKIPGLEILGPST